MGGTYVYTLAAEFALGEVDVREIVVDGDGFVGADLHALRAADTSGLAFLGGYATLFGIGASNPYTHAAGTLVAEFDDVTGASLYACAAAHTLFVVKFSQTGLGIDADGVVVTSHYAVATAETAEGA